MQTRTARIRTAGKTKPYDRERDGGLILEILNMPDADRRACTGCGTLRLRWREELAEAERRRGMSFEEAMYRAGYGLDVRRR